MIEAFILLGFLIAIPYISQFTGIPEQYGFLFAVGVGLIFLVLLLKTTKTAPYVPTSRKKFKAMFDLADIQAGDTVYELGCGDGAIIRTAGLKKVKKVIGYDISLPLIAYGKIACFFSKTRAKILFGDIWKQDYRDADVMFCYLLTSSMEIFYKEIWPTLKKGTRVVSNTFLIKDTPPDRQEGQVYLYIKK